MIAIPAETDTLKKPVHILHLEDSAVDHELASLVLRRAQLPYQIQQVDTLEGLLAALREAPFDIVLADYRLRGFTAIDAWNLARPLPACPPFVLLSGAIGEAAAVNAMHLGFSDYLLKDDVARLPRVIARAIEMAESRHAREQAMAELATTRR